MSKTKAERRHMDLTASLGCVACRNAGLGASPAELHHVRAGQGVGQRARHTQVLPLCPRHHRASYPTGFHAAPRSWQAEHGTELELLEQVTREVNQLERNFV